ncbi:hypothetical protein Y027_5866 [Burkholderia pseudomallei TSV5]|nr:hypothetical protein Y025_5764 [Burkholderia pseudomallei TSV32]KGX49005.1 hypothetical protein Y027_5866 [Burkholderia pseudomallei TSV5]
MTSRPVKPCSIRVKSDPAALLRRYSGGAVGGAA